MLFFKQVSKVRKNMFFSKVLLQSFPDACPALQILAQFFPNPSSTLHQPFSNPSPTLPQPFPNPSPILPQFFPNSSPIFLNSSPIYPILLEIGLNPPRLTVDLNLSKIGLKPTQSWPKIDLPEVVTQISTKLI